MPEEQECKELVCDVCDLPVYDFSLVNYPLYTNSEISFFLPCPIGMVCTDADGNVIDGTTITIPPGTMTFRPTTESQNSQEAAQAAMTGQAQDQAANGQIPGGGGGGSGPGGGGSPGLNPKPKLFFNTLVDMSCGTGGTGIIPPGFPFFVGPGHVQIPAGLFSSKVSQAAAQARAVLLASQFMEFAQCTWVNTEQSYTAHCPAGKFGDPVTKTIPAGTFSSEVSQENADAMALTAAQDQAEEEIFCYNFGNTEQTATCPEGESGDPVTKAAGTFFSNASQAAANAAALAAAESELVCTACSQNKVNELTWIHSGSGSGSAFGSSGSLTVPSNGNSVLTSSGITNDCGADFDISITLDYTLLARTINFNQHTSTASIVYDGITQQQFVFTSTQCGNAFCDCETDSGSINAFITIPNGSINKVIQISLNRSSDDQGCDDSSANFTIVIP